MKVFLEIKFFSIFINNGAERILKSFSRRLSYLHQCKEAREIAEDWLSPGGLLGDVSKLNELGITLLSNIAPVAPIATLEAIERAASGDNGQEFTSRNNKYFSEFTRILRSLAYDPELFDRCSDLICRFALSEDPKENSNSIQDLFKSFFYIYLSGTHATLNQRLHIVDSLIKSSSEREQELGLLLLGAALEAWHFTSHGSFDFGAHSRDYGYSPKTREEIIEWYAGFIGLLEKLAVSELPIAVKAKKLIAQRFRGLWIKAGVFDELVRVTKSIVDKGSWNEGWIAVRATIRFDAEHMKDEPLSQLRKLEKLLAPNNLLEKARTYALSDHTNSFDLDDIEGDTEGSASDRYGRVEEITRQLGKEVANDESIFKALLSDIVTGKGARLYSFAQGLAEGCSDPLLMWQNIREQLASVDDIHRNFITPCGFLSSIAGKNRELSDQILDNAVTDEILGTRFPLLQTSVEIDEQGVNRLKESLVKGIAPIWTYRNLAWGRVHELINDEDLCELLKLIASRGGGLAVAIEILHMRIYNNKDNKLEHSDIIISTGQQLLSKYVFDSEKVNKDHMDYELGIIADACLVNEDGASTAETVCINYTQALLEYNITPWDYDDLLNSIARKQPQAFLNNFLGDIEVFDYRLKRVFTNEFERKTNPLSQIDNSVIIDWCEIKPSVRYPIIAASIIPFSVNKDNNQLEWTPLALFIINNTPDVIEVLNEFKRTFRPTSWVGSRADIMQKGLDLISSLKSHQNPVVVEWARIEERVLEEEIKSERRWEQENTKSRDQRFE